MRRIKFIANRDFALTLNRIYDIQNEQANRYYVINDNGVVAPYAKNLFEVVEENQPVPNNENAAPLPRRRGRPSNAELAARAAAQQQNLAQQVPVEDPRARAAREAREAEQARQLAEQRELERRGRLWTEQDMINSIVVSFSAGNGRLSFSVSYNKKERLNDPDNIVQRHTSNVSFQYDNDFSCGITRVVNVQSFLVSIHNMIDYQEGDYDALREALFAKVGQVYQQAITVRNGNIRSAAIDLMSVTVGEIAAVVDYKNMLINHFGFAAAGADQENPNSGNTICVLVRNRRA